MDKNKDLFSRLKIRVIWRLEDGTTQTTYPTRKTQITRKSVLGKMKSATLRVQYLPDVMNEGDFETKKDLLQAFDAWTDEQQLKYVYEGKW